MATDKETLLSFGFDAARVDWALKATSNAGLQPAMDHILANEGKEIPDLSAVTSSGVTSGAGEPMDEDDEDAETLRGLVKGGASSADLEPKSIKCSECGKVFRNTAMANYHAEKSGHQQFEESTEEARFPFRIKPLTEEEKKQKLIELREKMAAKRAAKAVEDEKEQRVSEGIRRKANKDMGAIKEDLAAKQAIKEAEQKKRDKIEDAKAKAAIKAQIELDKKARAEKFAREKALRHGQPITDNMTASSSTPAAAATAAASGVAGRDFKETRLQIRLSTGGQPYTTTLSSDAKLRQVAEYVAGQAGELMVEVEAVSFSQHFPRKTFTHADLSKSLRELGLTPSAVLIATLP